MKNEIINFNKIDVTKKEKKYVMDSIKMGNLCGDGKYTKKVNDFFKDRFKIKHFLLTTSCSSALNMSAILLELKPGDEVIMPSYTFTSTANAVVLRGAIPVFCDIDKITMNIDTNLIENLITKRTKAIYCVHYAGVICDMDKIMKIAKKYKLYVVEDAAQAVGSYYNGKAAGTIGDIGCYSFHQTKNYSMGEGGALIINNEKFLERAEIIREKGTNRSQFLKGQVDKYTWQDIGSSFLPSDMLAAMLYGQLERFDKIMQKRMIIWQKYYDGLAELENQGKIKRQTPLKHNAHMFFIKTKNLAERSELITYLKKHKIYAMFHYVPLHSSPFAKRLLTNKIYTLPVTQNESEKLIRLPMHVSLKLSDVQKVINELYNFYKVNQK